MSHSGLDDYVAQGLCNMCYTQLDYKQGCPDCDDKCQQCGVYLWEYDEQTWKLIDDEPMCQDCWAEKK